MSSRDLLRLTWLPLVALAFSTGCRDRARPAVTQPADRPRAPEPTVKSKLDPNASIKETTSASKATAPRPQAGGRTTSSPDRAPAEARPEGRSRPPRRPKRPVDSWVIFREAFEPREDAACKSEWTGGNRLEVHTQNIQRVTLDLARLPEGAPRRGPWNLQIDGQGIEITGFKPKPGYRGDKRDLVRSENGNWTVDRKVLYRIGG